MPLRESTALCGPKVLSHALDITIPEAQADSHWVASQGTDPGNMVKALRKHGYKVEMREHCTVGMLESFREKHDKSIVIIDYFDDLFGAADGHYVIFLGLDGHGDVKVWNPDSESDYMVLPRKKLEMNWYDYKINDNSTIYRGLAIFAHK